MFPAKVMREMRRSEAAVIPLGLLVALVAFLPFLPCLRNGFVWDDLANFINNLNYRGLGWSHLYWIFTNTYVGPYQPISWLSSSIDYAFWGLNPLGYHLGNLLLHSANAALMYFVALRLLEPSARGSKGLPIAAACAALFFALHPLRVEPVAWATERRTMLAGLFYLSAVLMYLKSFDRSKEGDGLMRAGSLGLFALALLSKGISISLPVTLLLLDVYPLRRLTWEPGRWLTSKFRSILIEKIPFFLLAAAFAVVEIAAYRFSVGLPTLRVMPVSWRISQILLGISLYLAKTLLPIGLSPLYELPVRPSPLQWQAILSGILFLEITALVLYWRKSQPWALALWIFYVAALMPVSGVVPVSTALAADRYTYIACMGWCLLPGWLTLRWRPGVPIIAAILAVLAVLTWRQSLIWRNDEALWRHALSLNSEAASARNNLANVYLEEGKIEPAIELYRDAIAINPDAVHAYNNLATAYLRKGDLDKAIEFYREALSLDWGVGAVHNGLALAYSRRGNLRAAVSEYEIALSFAPGSAGIHFNLGETLQSMGHKREAAEEYKAALSVNPEFLPAKEAWDRLSSRRPAAR